jgi:hypothetical protein
MGHRMGQRLTGERMMGATAAKLTFAGAICAVAWAGIVPAPAQDMAAMISQYRREHGLRPVRTDAALTAVATRQAQAMASAGVLDHAVAGSISSRIAQAPVDSAGENIAAGTKTWSETLRVWEASPGHNENLLRADADIVGVAVAYNNSTRFKSYWAMVIAHKAAPRRSRGGPAVMMSGSFVPVAAAPPAVQVAAASPASRAAAESPGSPAAADEAAAAAPRVAAESPAASASPAATESPASPAAGEAPEQPAPAASPAPAPRREKRAARAARTQPPGLLDQLGTAIKHVTRPIRNLWN